ncbi:twin-arginine translocation pathway signal protein [Paucibacter sp. KBW04]|uniref:sulfatase family protein n=1 Tax=Paucibacter sp. KBW04 TaxID=2153361 RepID=UPI000F574570|nr:sulfatase-like hydrolase/transferase [Paucibacter sp. KBW04]RQO59969.1 twin-arginine translocation pathway signal protein [Paucibacter sp. KBW04]
MGVKRRHFIAAGAGGLALGSAAAQAASAGKPPHIVFIMADDLGWGDLSCFGQTEYQTPHLDALAAGGQRLRHAYANSPVCSASRTALITGRYQYRLRVGLEEPIPGPNSPHGLAPEQPTLPGLLHAAGYHSALVGKWHLGHGPQFGPLKGGYQEFYGNLGGGVDYFSHKDGADAKARLDFWDGDKAVQTTGYYTDLLSDRAVQILRRHAAPEAKPLFLSLHYTAPHWPWEGPDDEAMSRRIKSLIHHDGGSLEIYGRMVQAMDSGVGRVLRALDEAGMADNTLIVFTSDNGGERFSRMWPLSGQKTELLEGGIRVPTLLRWPAQIKPGVSDQVAIGMDWLPTLLAAAGAPAYAATDGINLLPLLKGEQAPQPRKLFWRYKAQGQRALREGEYKYLRIKGREFLFNVLRDPRERANLASLEPARLATLRADWEAWNASMLPITPEVFTHWVRGDRQADRYGVEDAEPSAKGAGSAPVQGR